MPTANRPYIICHMCTTIDGRIMTDRWGKLPAGRGGASLFESTADTFGVNAWIVGTTTMHEFASKGVALPPGTTRVPHDDVIAPHDGNGFAIGVDAKGATRWKNGVVEGDHVVLLLTDRVSNAYLAHLRAAGVSYLFCGKRDVDLHVAVRKLRAAFKLKKLMLEGGGKMNGSFLHAGLIDEISHVVIPVADGATGVSTMFDIPGDAPARAAAHLRLTSTRKMAGGVIWSKYRVTNRSR